MELPFAVEGEEEGKGVENGIVAPAASSPAVASSSNSSVEEFTSKGGLFVPGEEEGGGGESNAVIGSMSEYKNIHMEFYPPPPPMPEAAESDPREEPSSDEATEPGTKDPRSNATPESQLSGNEESKSKMASDLGVLENEEISDSFVTVCESDAADEDVDDANDNSEKPFPFPQPPFGGGGQSGTGGDILGLLLGNEQSSHSTLDTPHGETNSSILVACEEASLAATEASDAKRRGDMESAVTMHATAARSYRNAAISIAKADAPLSRSLLLLSNAQARSGFAVQNVLHMHGTTATATNQTKPTTTTTTTTKPKILNSSSQHQPTEKKAFSQQDRLRATIRDAMGTDKKEADITDSTFLGIARSNAPNNSAEMNDQQRRTSSSKLSNHKDSHVSTKLNSLPKEKNNPTNPVDDMMDLERELRDMNMALDLGNSLTSTLGGSRTERLKPSAVAEGSFCVVPSSNLSSSFLNGSPTMTRTTTAPPPLIITTRQKNRLANVALNASSNASMASSKPHTQQQQQQQQLLSKGQHAISSPAAQQQQHQQHQHHSGGGLESSWWGQASVHSSTAPTTTTTTTYGNNLASSAVSIGSRSTSSILLTTGGHDNNNNNTSSSSANTKQLMRLLDSLKTLGDENASLLREVEGAKKSQQEAKAARIQMKQFQTEYGKRFQILKAALDKFKRQYPGDHSTSSSAVNPVSESNYGKSTASATAELRRRDEVIRRLTSELERTKEEVQNNKKPNNNNHYLQPKKELKERDDVIRKLTSDLEREKEEGKKKDVALKKYESFYREVKARSALKARQREKEEQQQQQQKMQQQQQTQSPQQPQRRKGEKNRVAP